MDQAHPMVTIDDPNGKAFISVIDTGVMVRLQLHKYNDIYTRGVFVTIDKRALPDLIHALQELV